MRNLLKLSRRGIATFIFLIVLELIKLGYQLTQISTRDVYVPKKIFNITVDPNISKETHISMIVFFVIFFLWIIFSLIKLINISRNQSVVDFFSVSGASKIILFAKLVFISTSFLCFISLTYEFLSSLSHLNNLEQNTAYDIGYFIGGSIAVISSWLPFVILGIFLLIIGQITKLGALYKQENDLTI